MGQCALAVTERRVGAGTIWGRSDARATSPEGTSRLDASASGPPNVGRYFRDIVRTRSFELRAKWSGQVEPIPAEFEAAARLICVKPEFMASTRALESLLAIERQFERDPSLHRRMSERASFDDAIAAVVMRAYGLADAEAARAQKDLLYDCLICERFASLYAELEWRQPFLTFALVLLGAQDDVDALPAKLSEVCDRAERCSSAKRHAFSLLIARAAELIAHETRDGADAPEAAEPPPPLRWPERRGADGGGALGTDGGGGGAQRSAAGLSEAETTAGTSAPLDFDSSTRTASISSAASAAALGALGAGGAGGARSDGLLDVARADVHRVFADFLDEYKERAISSAFVEPVKYYFDSVGDTFGRDHVAVHGVNWFLAVLHSSLGVQAPFLVDYDDRHVLGLADVWAAFSEEVWQIFAEPANFGRQFTGIRALRERRADMLVMLVPSGQLPRGTRTTAPKTLANMAVHAQSPRLLRLALARYAERFAYFFGREPFVRRCFEALWSEVKPEHAGFRKACDALYAHAYRAEMGAREGSLVEHVYVDEYFTQLDIERVECFFSWLGLVRAPPLFAQHVWRRTHAARVIAARARGRAARATYGAALRAAAQTTPARALQILDLGTDLTTAERVGAAAGQRAGGGGGGGDRRDTAGSSSSRGLELSTIEAALTSGTCPICYEARADIQMLPHWHATGDVSEHCMCGSCRAQYGGNTCPFCKDVLAKDELLATISGFIDSVSARASAAEPDPNELAALLERWQTFEMELDAQPSVLRRVTRLIAEDVAFSTRLAHGVRSNASWLRDTAGVLFRFHALAADGELDASPATTALLASAVEALLAPFERELPAVMHGHYYGALYTQALVPWLCAWRSGTSTRTAVSLVQRVGVAIVRAQLAYGAARRELRGYVRARMHLEYVQLAHTPVWGGQERDLVWQTFFA